MARAIGLHYCQCETHRLTQTDIHTHICTNADSVNGEGDRCPWLQSPSVHKPVTVSVRRGVCICGCIVYMSMCGCVVYMIIYVCPSPSVHKPVTVTIWRGVCICIRERIEYMSIRECVLYMIIYICLSPSVHKPVTVSIWRGVCICICECMVYMSICKCVVYMHVQAHLYTNQSPLAFEEVCVYLCIVHMSGMYGVYDMYI